MSDRKPFEIARETLKQISARKLPPTPTNYQTVYHEISGQPVIKPFPEDELRAVAQALPARTPGQEKQRGLLEYSIGRHDWAGVHKALLAYAGFVSSKDAPPSAAAASAEAPLTPEFFEQIARVIEYIQPALGEGDARFLEKTQQLLTVLRNPGEAPHKVKAQLAEFTHRLSFAAEDQAEIRQTLLRLLQLIIAHLAELGVDDSWLKAQVETLQQAIAPPLTLRRLDEVERRLKDVLFKQAEAKDREEEAQVELRRMISVFISRLAQMAESSGAYQGKLEEALREVEQARKLEDIAPVLKQVIDATRTMRDESETLRSELHTMREEVQRREAEVADLHRELDRVSAQARHDGLTGALNRRGLDEALERELSSVRRKGGPLSVALLDIDEFKQLNDARGHETGDAALTHLADVVREIMRPQDTLARYGGEEFVILLPDTPLEKGVEAMVRLQRELSARFFLAGEDKVFITFSAGVAQLAEGESGVDVIRRADQAMYLAKRAGKNRVVSA